MSMADPSIRIWSVYAGLIMAWLAVAPAAAADVASITTPTASAPVSAPPPPLPGQAPPENVLGGSVASMPGEYSYNPSGRRDPFSVVLKDSKTGEPNQSLPPLQQLSLTELNVIGIVWGGFGYSAMVQAPDGKGYTVRQGTRVGPNGGAVSSITENAIVVQERFTDVYGNKQVREYVKLLHAKEGSE
jgi:type IV pilus assembly protein PilP